MLYSRSTLFKFDIQELTMMLGTIEILSSACQVRFGALRRPSAPFDALPRCPDPLPPPRSSRPVQSLPTKLPMLTNIAGLSCRIIELFDELDRLSNRPPPTAEASTRC